MDPESEQLFQQEAGNWLSRGRSHLLGRLVAANLASNSAPPRVLEIGAGFGENVPTLALHGAVDVLEVSGPLADRLAADPLVDRLYREPIPSAAVPHRYDVIVAWDVLEHIERDDLAIDWIHDHLNERGVLVAAVPAYQWLFSDHDRAIHHYRRYTRHRLLRLVGRRLAVRHHSYFNTTLFPLAAASRAAWQVQRRVRGHAGIPAKQSSATSPRLDDWFGRILESEGDRIATGGRAPFGLSAVCVAERRAARPATLRQH